MYLGAARSAGMRLNMIMQNLQDQKSDTARIFRSLRHRSRPLFIALGFPGTWILLEAPLAKNDWQL
jgi:hypothetical protein